MVETFNPIQASESIIDSVERYLRTTFKPRRGAVAKEYSRALDEARKSGELGGSLFREVRREFAKGDSLESFIERGSASERLLDLVGFPLHAHQSKAFSLVSEKNRNVVVATGTGSGKTESFLLPIINSILGELQDGSLDDGIRAVLVYPMNALAADQMDRIRSGLQKFPEISYGRFVGPTPHTDADAKKKNKGVAYPPNERPSRESMLRNPPHVLVTNYAMLERLLLLPEWESLFSKRMKWIVLDEVHSYDGTKGVEIGLLLRRLKERTASPLGVQCIAASATLGDGSKADLERAARFAGNLFGETFEPEDIILPEYPAGSTQEPLVDVFDSRNSELRAKYLNDPSGMFHLFVRNPGGAFICLKQDHPADKPRLNLQAKKWCSDCDDSRLIELGTCRNCGVEYLIARLTEGELFPVEEFDDAARYFRLLTTPFSSWPLEDQKIRDDIRDADDEDEIDDDIESLWFCEYCSRLSSKPKCTKCSKDLFVEVDKELINDSNGVLRCRRCNSSGGRSPFGPIARPVSGVDALTAVIATSLYDHLPDSAPGTPGDGKKLLTFSDNRQDAAYFAPYLEDSYGDFFRRRAIAEALEKLCDQDYQDPPFSLKHLASTLSKLGENFKVEKGDSLWAWAWIRAELVAIETQQSLSGTGHLRWFVPQEFLSNAIESVKGYLPDNSKAHDLINILLDTVRYDGAIELPDGISPSDPIFAPKQSLQKIFLEGKKPNTNCKAWISGAKVGNKRTDAITKGLGLDRKEANELLNKIWFALIKDEVLEDVGAGQFVLMNKVYRVKPGIGHTDDKQFLCPSCRNYSWYVLPNGECITKGCTGKPKDSNVDDQNHYRYLSSNLGINWLVAKEHTAQWTPEMAEVVQNEFITGEVNILSCSTTFEMGVDIGDISAVLCRNVPPTPANYVQRAGRAGRRSGVPALAITFARKRSHDAQYANDPVRLIRGQVPVPTVVLDNSDLARRHIYAMALSAFLRSSNYTGKKASEFLLADSEGVVGSDLFVEWLNSHPKELLDSVNQLDLPKAIQKQVGIENWAWVELLTTENAEHRGGWLTSVSELFASDDSALDELIADLHSKAIGKDGPKYASMLAAAGRVKEDLRSRQLVELFANGGILPKYGFPVDVASLVPRFIDRQSRSGLGIELNRDLSLAISEYAPGSQVVAGGRVLTSVGVKKPVDKTFGAMRWVSVTCNTCGWFYHALAPFGGDYAQELPTKCGNCSGFDISDGQEFIQPKYGFIAAVDSNSAGSKMRPKRIGGAKTYLSSQSTDDEEWTSSVSSKIATSVSRDARLLTLGKLDYFLCLNCGYASPLQGRRAGKAGLPNTHNRPETDKPCDGQLSRTKFGHHFVTDVLRLNLKVEINDVCICEDSQCLGPLESLAAALVAGAVRVLGVASADLNSSVTSSRMGSQNRLMIFDTTPGGAGVAQMANERLGEILVEAKGLISRCSCDSDSSCYSCIRSYNNQWRHEHLTRKSALELLESLEDG